MYIYLKHSLFPKFQIHVLNVDSFNEWNTLNKHNNGHILLLVHSIYYNNII